MRGFFSPEPISDEKSNSNPVNPVQAQLRCLVLASKSEHHKRVSAWLGVSKRVSSVTAVDEARFLCKHLESTGSDLCVIVVNGPDDSLPGCIKYYASMPVLVLSSNRESGEPSHWFQQGATDVASMRNTDASQHAISRLIDECIAKQTQRYLQTRNEQLMQEIDYLRSMINSDKRSFTISASNEAHFDASDRKLSTGPLKATDSLEAALTRMPQPSIENVVKNYKARDAATGLPARSSVLERASVPRRRSEIASRAEAQTPTG